MYTAWLLTLVSPPANAIDLADFDVAFTVTVDGQGGSDGADAALDAAIDDDGNAVFVGYLDGDVGHSTDAKVLALAPDGTTVWELDPIDAGVDDGTQGSDDRFEAVSIDPTTGAYVWCGQTGGAGVGVEPRHWFRIVGSDVNAKGTGDLPEERYAFNFRAGGAESLENSCFGVAQNDQLVYAAGFGQGNGDTNGQWVMRQYSDLGQFTRQLFVDVGANEDYPDQAYAVAVRDSTGDYVLAGTQQGNLDLPAWAVRYYAVDQDNPDSFVWSHLVTADNGKDARALAAHYDSARRVVYVAGALNQGKGDADDRDWYVVAYDDTGYDGGADVEWEARHGVGSGMDEIATGIAIDENNDVIVAGTTRDPSSGNAVWRVVVLDRDNGVLLSEWIGPDNGGDSILEGFDFRDGRIALAGSIDDGSGRGPDFATAILELDEDDDGVTDSIDACPSDPTKSESPGVCGCGQPDVDSDEDGVLNCNDGCPGDPNKLEPGECGCGSPDVDTDQDGVLNCDDFCPGDPNKVAVGICGCGTPDDDEDGDGVVRCRDACPDTESGVAVNDFGCPDESSTDDPNDPNQGGGGCNTASGTPAMAGLLILGLLGWRSRRRR
ncbi:MAG: MYXO-CTERM sorting domain-containing protein [Myxococcota bacterium]